MQAQSTGNARLPWVLTLLFAGTTLWLGLRIYKPALFEKAEVAVVREVEEQVRARLKDPESARFSGVWIGPDAKYACGDVNAKNAMGGYAGSTAFMLQRATGHLEFMPAEASATASYQEQLDAIDKKLKFVKDVQRLCGEPPATKA